MFKFMNQSLQEEVNFNMNWPVANGKAIADRPRQRDNFRAEVGPRAAPASQLTLKDDSDAKVPKGPKIKEKKPQII